MGNMSYCRFQNTLGDLRQCYHAMCEEREEDWSPEELTAFKALMKLCKRIADQDYNA